MFEEPKKFDKPKDVLNVDFIKGKIDIENEPLCEAEHIENASIIVENNIDGLTKDLPDNHPWKEGKLLHRVSTMVECNRTIYKNFQDRLPEENYSLLEFLASVHDLGRAVEAKRKLGLLKDGYRDFSSHGQESVALLKDWNALDKYPEDTQEIIEYAIAHHSDIITPEIGEDPSSLDKLKYFFTSILRDVDKLSIFRNKTDKYLDDEEEKKKQVEVNNVEGEKGTIDPPDLLQTFARREMIDRSKCRSYEAFMLQYLAWIFDFNLKISLEQTLQIGAVNKILYYFKQQLPNEQYTIIEQTVSDYFKDSGFNIDFDE